jgi:hypothetical protein
MPSQIVRQLRNAALACAALALLPAPAAAQTPLFAGEAPVNLTIEASLDTLIGRAARSTAPFPATLTLTRAGGASQSFNIQLSARGLTRRTRGFCQFPPLRIEFARGTVARTLFAGQSRLKLVTHCRPNPKAEERIAIEMTAYRLYNLITPMSFRVRPAQVTYRDTDGRRPPETRIGVLVEDIDDLARRNGRAEFEAQRMSPAQLDAQASARYALFQFMIGNLDWSLISGPAGDECCHNTRFIAARGASAAASPTVFPIPYDFDFSGLVDAPYATPPADIPVNSIRSRVYRGFCRHNGQVPAAAAAFRAQRRAMTALIAEEDRLSAAQRQRMTNYLAEFFAILDDPARLDRAVVRRCRN